MISNHIRDAIIALLATDTAATEEDREAVALAMSGTPADGPAVISFKEVCARLGRSRQTVYNLIRRGLLTPVRGAGMAGYSTGVTASSLAEYIRGKRR